MKKLSTPELAAAIPSLKEEIWRSKESRYDHRLHAILLIAQGMTCREVGPLLGVSHAVIANWTHRYLKEGLAGLLEKEHPGKPRQFTDDQRAHIAEVLRLSPKYFGFNANRWTAKIMADYLNQKWQINLNITQSQKLLRQFGLRLLKPRPCPFDPVKPTSEVCFQYDSSRCRMWVPPKTKVIEIVLPDDLPVHVIKSND